MRFDTRADGDLPPNSEFAIHLPGRHGDAISAPDYPKDIQLVDNGFLGGVMKETRTARVGLLALDLSRPTLRFAWPCTPINTYNPTMRADFRRSVLRVSLALAEGPVRLTARIAP